METSGSRLSQREEDIAHDGGTADAGGCDNVEDPVYIVTEVFLETERRRGEGGQTTDKQTNNSNSSSSSSHPVCVQVLRLFQLDWVDFTRLVFCTDLGQFAETLKCLFITETETRWEMISYLVYDRFECDLQIVHACQLHGLINALRSQRVSPENRVWVSANEEVCFLFFF